MNGRSTIKTPILGAAVVAFGLFLGVSVLLTRIWTPLNFLVAAGMLAYVALDQMIPQAGLFGSRPPVRPAPKASQGNHWRALVHWLDAKGWQNDPVAEISAHWESIPNIPPAVAFTMYDELYDDYYASVGVGIGYGIGWEMVYAHVHGETVGSVPRKAIQAHQRATFLAWADQIDALPRYRRPFWKPPLITKESASLRERAGRGDVR